MAIVLLLTVIGAVLRWNGLREHGLWLDEIGEAVTASLPMPQLLASVRSQAGAAPLDFLGVKVVTAVLGPGTTPARLWAFGMGVAAIPLAYAAASRLASSRVAGIATAICVSLSPFLILYSREARFYAMSVAGALLVILVHQWANERPARNARWLAYGAAVAAAILTHYYLGFVAVALGIADVIAWRMASHRRRRRMIVCRELLAGGIALLVAGPWLISALPFQLGRTFYWDVTGFSLDFWSGMVAMLGTASADPDVGGTAAVLVLLVAAVAGATWRPAPSKLALGALGIVLVPLIWLLDSRSGYQVTSRQAILLLPILYLLAGVGLGLAWTRLRRRASPSVLTAIGGTAVIAFVVAMGGAIGSVMGRSGSASEDWPGAARFVAATRCAGSTVFTNLGSGAAFGVAYYEPDLAGAAQQVLQDGESFQDALGAQDPSRRDFAVVLAYAGGADSPNVRSLGAMRAWFIEGGWEERAFGSQLLVFHRDTCSEAPSQ
ncbi:MAG TPA: glycosyltransferase family 39 protein [Candidatus Limnocylindria bacterium]|nr:glycosyltransferase family 39 protein [Candidatus Limnocylindria bacterium]